MSDGVSIAPFCSASSEFAEGHRIGYEAGLRAGSLPEGAVGRVLLPVGVSALSKIIDGIGKHFGDDLRMMQQGEWLIFIKHNAPEQPSTPTTMKTQPEIAAPSPPDVRVFVAPEDDKPWETIGRALGVASAWPDPITGEKSTPQSVWNWIDIEIGGRENRRWENAPRGRYFIANAIGEARADNATPNQSQTV